VPANLQRRIIIPGADRLALRLQTAGFTNNIKVAIHFEE
jgi:hypothetical protein